MNKSVRYTGIIRLPEGCCVQVDDNDGAKIMRLLNPRNDLFNHSPKGFEWGYGGSGPAQLALAILADALGDDERAVRLHQKFKFEYIAKLPYRGSPEDEASGWFIWADEVREWAARQL